MASQEPKPRNEDDEPLGLAVARAKLEKLARLEKSDAESLRAQIDINLQWAEGELLNSPPSERAFEWMTMVQETRAEAGLQSSPVRARAPFFANHVGVPALPGPYQPDLAYDVHGHFVGHYGRIPSLRDPWWSSFSPVGNTFVANSFWHDKETPEHWAVCVLDEAKTSKSLASVTLRVLEFAVAAMRSHVSRNAAKRMTVHSVNPSQLGDFIAHESIARSNVVVCADSREWPGQMSKLHLLVTLLRQTHLVVLDHGYSEEVESFAKRHHFEYQPRADGNPDTWLTKSVTKSTALLTNVDTSVGTSG
jgi:hypothetical protein